MLTFPKGNSLVERTELFPVPRPERVSKVKVREDGAVHERIVDPLYLSLAKLLPVPILLLNAVRVPSVITIQGASAPHVRKLPQNPLGTFYLT